MGSAPAQPILSIASTGDFFGVIFSAVSLERACYNDALAQHQQ
jgi:hypothetical protein